MSAAEKYPWVVTPRGIRLRGDGRAHNGRRRDGPNQQGTCSNCGYEPLGRRVRCPACHRPTKEGDADG